MHIDQKTLDAAGQAPNPAQNCTLAIAQKIQEFLKDSMGIIDSVICVNFTSGGPVALPYVPVTEITPAKIGVSDEYNFVLVKDYNPDSSAPTTTNCAAVAVQLAKYPAYDVAVQQLNGWNGVDIDTPYNPINSDILAPAIKDDVQQMWD